jgi:hypothetical protein
MVSHYGLDDVALDKGFHELREGGRTMRTAVVMLVWQSDVRRSYNAVTKAVKQVCDQLTADMS